MFNKISFQISKTSKQTREKRKENTKKYLDINAYIDGTTEQQMLKKIEKNIDEKIIENEKLNNLREALKILTEKEKRIIQYYFFII